MSDNNKLILEFERLIAFVQKELDCMTDPKIKTANTFRLKQIRTAYLTIKKYSKQITIENLKEFGELPGIGSGTINRIKEILTKGKLSELKDFKDTNKKEEDAITELQSIVGIGRSIAIDLVNQGIHSIDELKKAIKKGDIEVNEKIMLGIKYHGVFQGDIPREEIDSIYKMLTKIFDKLNTSEKLTNANKYVFEICGSYRREKSTSGDIDVLVSKMGTTDQNEVSTNHLAKIILLLKKKKLLVDDITDNFETKYMGFAQYKNNPVRRIDVRFVTWEHYYSALVYFTGSAELNKRMRSEAKKMKLKLSEYGLQKQDGTYIPIHSEQDIFKILVIPYLEPHLR
jgi:DNA polymerase/3'-5' exonuclease PolX